MALQAFFSVVLPLSIEGIVHSHTPEERLRLLAERLLVAMEMGYPTYFTGLEEVKRMHRPSNTLYVCICIGGTLLVQYKHVLDAAFASCSVSVTYDVT